MPSPEYFATVLRVLVHLGRSLSFQSMAGCPCEADIQSGWHG